MAPAVSASILSATSAGAAAASSKRPAASDAEPPPLDSVLLQQGDDDEEARKSQQQPKQQQQLECPRCQSTNTKFCYYNNYSTAQPRHFCRACRRYWTHGGTLRDVPVGGASRRSGGGAKRRRVSAEASSSASPPPPPAAENAAPGLSEDACLPATGFPFLSDGSFLPHFDFDLGVVAPVAFSSWPSSSVPGFYDGLAPWDDTTVSGAGIVGQWGDIAGLGLDLGWAPPGN